MAHNNHMLAFAAMMRGQSGLAIRTIDDMVKTMPAQWVKENAPLADGFVAMPLEVLVRFGRWDDVLASAEPPDYLPIARALRRCGRGIALAAKGEVAKAKEEQQAFLAAKAAVPAEARIGNNAAADVLLVAEHLLAGEILIRGKQSKDGIARLREAVKFEDQLRYSEPPDWIHPVRHALGATLLAERQFADAEKVYREDLDRLPNNGWSLFGLARSVQMQGKPQEAQRINASFEAAWRDADVKISSSCFCQPGP
jgi:tetratricopeptide (TPR) repeat protein